MRKKIKKALTFCYSKSKDCVEIIFQSPASNQLRLQREQAGRFGSYVQLKRYQKHIRKVALRVFLAIVFLFIGILIGPAIFTPEKSAEIFIPSGRGDILISNVSKSQASVIFKTLDSANQNKPLATSALVEVFTDEGLSELVKKTEPHDFAVTHIIPIEGLEEGKIYYLKISASESKDMEKSKEVSSWGGKEPIAVYATGDVIPTCLASGSAGVKDPALSQSETVPMGAEDPAVEITTPVQDGESEIFMVSSSDEIEKPETLRVLGVANENYLHGREKVQTIISWETNLPGTSVLVYREEREGDEKEVRISEEKVIKHAAVLTTLKPGTVYYFKVKSEDGKGAEAVSSEYSLRTPHPKDTVLEMVGNNFKALVRQVGL